MEIQKTSNIVIVETRISIMKLLSDSKLPATVQAMLLNDLATSLNARAQQTYEIERQQYEQLLSQEQKKDNK